MSKIFTVYFIVNTIESGKKQFRIFDSHTLPVKSVDELNEVLNQERVEYDVRDEIVKNILNFSVAYRNIKKN